MDSTNNDRQDGPVQRLVGPMNRRQQRALELLRADLKRDLYQACTWTEHCISYTAGEKYEYLTKADVAELESSGLIVRKWPDKPEIGCWVLKPNAELSRPAAAATPPTEVAPDPQGRP